MNEDRMDELLIQAARDYNTPGQVPRDDMWAAIAARRAPATRRRLWVWPTVGVAAAALLAVGVMLGRRLERQSVAAPLVAVKPVVVKAPANSTPAIQPDSVDKQLREETRKTDAAVRQLATSGQSPDQAAAERSALDAQRSTPDAQRPTSNLAYRLVVLRHLAGSEALITSFRTEAKRGELDSQIAQWSRELLSTTRLLEASAASNDPVMKRLLEDLDLIIAQIAVYAARGTNDPEELDLIEQSINQRGVIPKLRSTMPASPAATHM